MLKGIRRTIGVLGVAVAATLVSSAATRAETLTDALISAYRHSGLLEQNRAVLRAADEDVAIAMTSLRPVIKYALSSSWSDTNPASIPTDGITVTATLSAELLLYDFGRSQLGIEIAKENVLSTRDMLLGVEQQVLLRAVSAYLSMRSAAETVALQANNVSLISQELRAAKDRFEVGEITQTDVALAEARLAAARAAEAAAQGGLAIAREEYKAAIGHYPSALSAPPAPPMTVSTLDDAKAQARLRHPDMRVAQRQVTISELTVELALAGLNPVIAGTASSSVGTTPALPGGYTRNAIGITLSGTLYAGGKLSAQYRQAVARRDATRAGLHVTRHGIDQNVGNAWARLAIAIASLEATERQIRASRVALRGTREEQSLGARTTLDVLNAEQDLLDAQAAAIEAQSDQYLAVYSLLAAMGLLTAEHLNLGIATYDPEAYYNAVKDAPLTQVSPQGERLDAVLKALGQD